jgi:hypothetical protein
MRRIASGVMAASLIAAFCAGCDTVRPLLRPDPGVTGYAFCSGYAVQRYLYDLPQIERAAIETLSDLKVTNVQRKVEKNRVKLQGYLFSGRYLCMTIESEGPGVTIVSVNVDVYGDEPFSKIVLDRISIRMATMPRTVNSLYDPRSLSDSIEHRGQVVEGYRGAPLR